MKQNNEYIEYNAADLLDSYVAEAKQFCVGQGLDYTNVANLDFAIKWLVYFNESILRLVAAQKTTGQSCCQQTVDNSNNDDISDDVELS